MPFFIGLVVVFIILSLFYNIYTQCRSDLTQTEKHMIKHGDWFDAHSVWSEKGFFESDPSNTTAPVTRTIDMINLNRVQLLENGGWTCTRCGLINASYVGSCGCGGNKRESSGKDIKNKFVSEQNKIKVWICSNCGFKNPQTLDGCANCHSQRG